jgi:hypothetical protein
MHADALPITGPCPIDLDAIGFDRSGKVSHCTHCVKSVTNLSNMTKDEAREFLKEHKGEKLCVSYARGNDGKIRFRPEPEPALVPVTRLRPRPAVAPQPVIASQPVVELAPRRASRAAGLIAAFGVSATLAACTPHGDPPRNDVERVEMVEGNMKVPTVVVEPPQPETVPMAGAAEIPQEIMVDGEMAVPDPDVIDEPCDKTKDQGKRKDVPKPDTTKVEPPTTDVVPTAGMAMIPTEAMIEGEMKVPDPEALEEPTHARINPRR